MPSYWDAFFNYLCCCFCCRSNPYGIDPNKPITQVNTPYVKKTYGTTENIKPTEIHPYTVASVTTRPDSIYVTQHNVPKKYKNRLPK